MIPPPFQHRLTSRPSASSTVRLVLKNFNILFDWQRPDVAKQVVRFQRGVPERVAAPELDGPNR